MQQEVTALREENQQLRAEIDGARAERGDLETARQAAEARAAELTKTLEEATAKARKMEQQLVAVRSQGEQRIAAADAARAEAEERLSEMRDSLQRAEQEKARIGADLAKAQGELATAKEQVAAARQEQAQVQQRVAALQGERDKSEQRIAAADAARVEAEERLSEMRDSLQRAEQEKARIGADLAKVQGDLATAKEQVAAAGRERTQIEQRSTALQFERDDLSTRLADATARLGPSEAANAQLEREVAKLRQAARTAAKDTRELIETLAAIGLSAGPLEADAALLAESGAPSAGDGADSEGSDAAVPVGNVAAEAAPSQGPAPTSADADLQQTRTASATRPGDGEDAHLDQRAILGGRPAVFPVLVDLPPEKRQHVQSLLADLPSKLEERGLMTTVPGELLFTVGGDEVPAGAYTTLAKVAELIDMYDNREVLIIGHSDAMGDPARNKQLSERRAERVKEILVNNYEIAADRLSTEGLGDAVPIASNATPQGRRANRRVEVLILN
jgi:outer membrane protein OmpA-like peptidoglycan-associated protein/predicted nuclease with TOPRIM domain